MLYSGARRDERTVKIDTSQSLAGTWLVKVVTGANSVATWYAHMQKLDVPDGRDVGARRQLGDAGARGNATGCHLHFEVHLRNGTIYGPTTSTRVSGWRRTRRNA